jgi:hypothetical protein
MRSDRHCSLQHPSPAQPRVVRVNERQRILAQAVYFQCLRHRSRQALQMPCQGTEAAKTQRALQQETQSAGVSLASLPPLSFSSSLNCVDDCKVAPECHLHRRSGEFCRRLAAMETFGRWGRTRRGSATASPRPSSRPDIPTQRLSSSPASQWTAAKAVLNGEMSVKLVLLPGTPASASNIPP